LLKRRIFVTAAMALHAITMASHFAAAKTHEEGSEPVCTLGQDALTCGVPGVDEEMSLCAEFCIPSTGLSFAHGASPGTCASQNFVHLVEETSVTVQLAGF